MGRIICCGLGPGDPDLISVRADREIRTARHIAYFRKKGRPGQARRIADGLLGQDVREYPMEYPVTRELPFDSPQYGRLLASFYDDCAQRLVGIARHARRTRRAAQGRRRDRVPLFCDRARPRPGSADGARRMTGMLTIAGLGPGDAALITPEVAAALADATDVVGYAPYVARVTAREGLVRHASDNRQELQRAAEAMRLAAEGRRVVVVSSGDPGVFAMASAVFEALEASPRWPGLIIRGFPGV